MHLVVADTGPLNYLVLIGASNILCKLFTTIVVPEAVWAELRHPCTPAAVRAWAMQPPSWIDVRSAPASAVDDPALRGLDAGEQAALALAHAIHADLILMDDRAGVATARNLRLAVIGRAGPRRTSRTARSRRSLCAAHGDEFSLPPGNHGSSADPAP